MDVKNIISRINNLSHKEKYHILNILNANDIEYTKNTNGYFFNFLKIDSITLDKLIKCLELIEQNINLIKNMDKKRNDLINSYKIIIEEKLKSSFEKRKNEYIKHLSVQIYQTNISYNIKRIFHIRKNAKFSTNNCNQAELMLKEYQKSQTKFQKNSVYHRIYCTIRMNKRYTEPKIENESNNNNTIDDINKAYIKIQKKIHPDVSPETARLSAIVNKMVGQGKIQPHDRAIGARNSRGVVDQVALIASEQYPGIATPEEQKWLEQKVKLDKRKRRR